jgi:hypothetical protein
MTHRPVGWRKVDDKVVKLEYGFSERDLTELARMRDNGEETPFQTLVIELTGILMVMGALYAIESLWNWYLSSKA